MPKPLSAEARLARAADNLSAAEVGVEILDWLHRRR